MPKVHYLTPYSTEKNFGKAINEACALIPNDDWICLLDGDAMFLTPDWGIQIADVIEKHGKNFSLFGCLTNRLAQKTQRYNGEFSNNHDIKYHYGIAVECKNNWASVKDITTSRCVAGIFMLFPKKFWNKIKFQENTHHFDSLFSKAVIKLGGRLGLIEGLYMYHWYRGWSDNPVYSVGHLK